MTPTMLYQNGRCWVTDTGKWFEVWEDGVTASKRVASIGYGPAPRLGLCRAKFECDRRADGEDDVEQARRLR